MVIRQVEFLFVAHELETLYLSSTTSDDEIPRVSRSVACNILVIIVYLLASKIFFISSSLAPFQGPSIVAVIKQWWQQECA